LLPGPAALAGGCPRRRLLRRDKTTEPPYPYFGVNFGAASNSPPRWLYLNGGHGSVSSVQKIFANGFESTLTFSFAVGNNSAYWDWNLCAKDTESRDGLGLPGSHGCGAPRVRQTASYLG
jgi:hypothetical protein